MKQKALQQTGILMLTFLLSIAGASASFFPITALSSPNYSCSSETNLYLDQDNDADTIPDHYLYLRSNFRIPDQNPPAYNAVELSGNSSNPNNPNATRIYYYASDANVLSKMQGVSGTYQPLDNSTFYKASRVFPYNQWVRGIDTNDIRILFEKPETQETDNVVSIIYSYKYETAVGYRYTYPPTPSYRYNKILSGGDFHGLTLNDYVDRTNSKERRWSPIQSSETCKNYNLHRCGDGSIDTYTTGEWTNIFTGETCDDGPLNGTAGHCDSTCGQGGSTTEERCGDNIIQIAGTNYNNNPDTPSFEECDDGDLTGDNGDGLLNGDNPENFCTSICLPNFTETFSEEFVNG